MGPGNKQFCFPNHIFLLQKRVRQRHVLLNKCRAIEYICGKHIKDPLNSSCEEDTKADDDDVGEEEVSQTTSLALESFKAVAEKVLMNIRCRKVIAAVIKSRQDREAFEEQCFKFSEDEESILYRKFLRKWSNTWDVWGSRGKAMALYYQTMSNPDMDVDKTSERSSPTLTLTETQVLSYSLFLSNILHQIFSRDLINRHQMYQLG